MPGQAGHSKSACKNGRKGAASVTRGVLGRQQALSRKRALQRLARLLNTKSGGVCEEALGLLTLFGFGSDELTEAGIDYEMVCALERHYPLLLGG